MKKRKIQSSLRVIKYKISELRKQILAEISLQKDYPNASSEKKEENVRD